MLRRAGVVGDPAGHSLSPAIHRAGYAANGLDWAYAAYTVAPSELEGFVGERIDDPAWAGLSVTAPHKEAILAFGEADEPTRLLGAGNTLVFGADGARVFNTDVPGFVRAWRAHGLSAPRRAAILGNGATARSILLALAGLGVTDVTFLARRPERAVEILDLASILGVRAAVRSLDEGPGAGRQGGLRRRLRPVAHPAGGGLRGRRPRGAQRPGPSRGPGGGPVLPPHRGPGHVRRVPVGS